MPSLKCPYFSKKFFLLNFIRSCLISEQILFKEDRNSLISIEDNIPVDLKEFKNDEATINSFLEESKEDFNETPWTHLFKFISFLFF